MAKITREQELTLINETQNGNERAFNVLYEKYQPLVYKVVSSFTLSRGMSKKDYISFAEIGLMKAIKSFDTTRDSSLCSYAVTCIHHEIASCINRYDSGITTISIDGFVKNRTDEDGYDMGNFIPSNEPEPMDKEDGVQQIEHAIRVLTPKEREVFVHKHGVLGYQEMKLKEIAAMRGVGHEAVRKMLKKAEIKVEEELRNHPERF